MYLSVRDATASVNYVPYSDETSGGASDAFAPTTSASVHRAPAHSDA